MSQPWTPEPYQLRAVQHLCANPAAGLFAKPGMRKTSISLAAATVLIEEGAVTSALVLAPLRPCHKTWPAEIIKWADFNHLTYVVLHGKYKAADLKRKVDLYIINYEGLKWLAQQGLPEHIDMLIIDESTKVKNHRAKRSEILFEISKRMKRIVILTGTPRPNHLIDLFAQVRMLDGGERLGRFITRFRRQYFDDEAPAYASYPIWVAKEGAEEAIMDKLSDICMVLDYKGNLAMPPLYHNVIKVDLPESVREQYEEFAEKFYLAVGDADVTAPTSAAVGMKLRQIVGGGVYSESGGRSIQTVDRAIVEFETNKLEALRDLAEEQAGEPLIVAVGFLHEVERIRAYLGDDFAPVVSDARGRKSKGEIPYLGGGVSTARSNDIIDDWNAGKIPVLLAHPTSVAHGLNLQAGGSSVCWYCLTWNAEEFEQFNDRVWRSGQTNPVTVNIIVAENTIEDQRVLPVLLAKLEDQQGMFDTLSEKAGGSSHTIKPRGKR